MDLIINKISFTYSELWESLSELEKFDYSVFKNWIRRFRENAKND